MARVIQLSLGMLLIVFLVSSPAFSQSADELSTQPNISVDRLEILQTLLAGARETREGLRATIKTAAPSELPELQLALESINADLKKLESSFEQVAIGAVDVNLLGEIDTSFDWRTEVSEILRPILENMKSLTDKPRKIGKLKTLIEQNQEQQAAIRSALQSINQKLDMANSATTKALLTSLAKSWQIRKADNEQVLSIAQLQLAELQHSDVSWVDAVRGALGEFFTGRGLTLALAALVACLVWLLMRGVLKLFQLRARNEDLDDFQTRKRLAQYAYHALMLTLMLIAVIFVFYTRGDMLLMGLSMLAAAAIALGLRQAIPRFINEARILLNLGSVRENERVFYNGLPWKVDTLNMHSVLRNPELKGVLRLPLSQISSMVSRPSGKEPWYPASKGDFIVLDDERVMQVVRLTPETVELKDRGGTITAVPASEFYQWTFRNLCRGETFGISTVFGIDYRHQSISLNQVPEKFKAAIQRALNGTDHADAVKDVRVELKSAGDSSLDYWIYVTLDREAAKGYSKLNRIIHQACVQICTELDWGIPFPHMTIQQFKESPA